MNKHETNAQLLLESLIDFLSDEVGVKFKGVREKFILKLQAGENELDLRYIPTSGIVTIINIRFNSIRTGHGTRLLKFLAQQGQQFNYDQIRIKAPFTDEMIDFYTKHKFKPENTKVTKVIADISNFI